MQGSGTRKSPLACIGIGCGIGCLGVGIVLLLVVVLPVLRATGISDDFMEGFKGESHEVSVVWDLDSQAMKANRSQQSPGMVLLIVRTAIKNVGYDRVPVKASYCTLTVNDTVYHPPGVYLDHALQDTNLRAGESAYGAVAFQVPAAELRRHLSSGKETVFWFEPVCIHTPYHVLCLPGDVRTGKHK